MPVYSEWTMVSAIKTEAAQEAEKLLDAAWPLRLTPVDPIAVARTAGLRVVDAPLPEETLGALIKTPGEEPTIMINDGISEHRRRFTCAHELGHWVRRRADEEEYSSVDLRGPLSSDGDDPEEIFANEFAASLLMPEEEFRHAHTLGRNDILLGIEFNVSREAAQFRLKNLGLTSP